MGVESPANRTVRSETEFKTGRRCLTVLASPKKVTSRKAPQEAYPIIPMFAYNPED